MYIQNPSNTITFEFEGNTADLKIWNILGEKVLEKRITNKELQDVVNLKNGVYVYQIKNSFGVAKKETNHKLMKIEFTSTSLLKSK